MVKKITVVVLVLVLVVVLGVVVTAGQEKTQKVDMELVGTVIDIGDGSVIFEVDLKGSPGKAYARGVSTSDFPTDMGDKCVDIGEVDGMNTKSAQIAIIFEDGSMLFGNMDDNVPSYVCFASPSQAAYKIEGGTGRFEAASGDIVFELITYAFGGPEGAVIAETGHGTGQITLP